MFRVKTVLQTKAPDFSGHINQKGYKLEDKVLGEGSYGIVFRGTIVDNPDRPTQPLSTFFGTEDEFAAQWAASHPGAVTGRSGSIQSSTSKQSSASRQGTSVVNVAQGTKPKTFRGREDIRSTLSFE